MGDDAAPRRRALWRIPLIAAGAIVSFWGLLQSVYDLSDWGYLLPIDKPWIDALPCFACALGPLIVVVALPWGRANRLPRADAANQRDR